MNRTAQILVLTSLAWGTLAFGATYDWASRPLAVLAGLSSVCCATAAWRSPSTGKPLAVAMVLVLCAIGVQLIPLSHATIASLNPFRHELLRRLDLRYRFDEASSHALSINPALTMRAMVFCAVSFAWVAGLSKLLTLTGATWLIRGLTVLGVAIAMEGIVQNAVSNGRVYGFWTPQVLYSGQFGPFINKNHFAGWMLMVLPLTCALFMSSLKRTRISAATWRDRLLWLSSEGANRLVLLAAGAGVMALALVLTLSRSGILAMFVSLLIPAGLALRTGGGDRRRRVAVTLVPLIVGILILIWVGPDLADRFRRLDDLRIAAWTDAVEIGRHFLLAGTGLNTYGTATLILQTRLMYMHFVQAHNDYLQLWVEGGILLVAPALVLAGALAARIAGRFRQQAGPDWFRAGAVVGMFAILLQEAVEFSLQMPANLLLFATLCAIAIHEPPAGGVAQRAGTRPRR